MENKNKLMNLLENISKDVDEVKNIINDNKFSDLSQFVDNEVTVDFENREIIKGDLNIKLTQTENKFLMVLIVKFERVVSYNDLCLELYNLNLDESFQKALRTVASRLRKKINPVFELKNIRNSGFVLKKRKHG